MHLKKKENQTGINSHVFHDQDLIAGKTFARVGKGFFHYTYFHHDITKER